jgi:uncharacterized membrane protein (DUF2068 family)
MAGAVREVNVSLVLHFPVEVFDKIKRPTDKRKLTLSVNV